MHNETAKEKELENSVMATLKEIPKVNKTSEILMKLSIWKSSKEDYQVNG